MGDPQQAQGYSVLVDANSGAVMEWGLLAGIGSKPRAHMHVTFDTAHAKALQQRRALQQKLGFAWNDQKVTQTYPPLLIGGRPYIYAGYLTLGRKGARLVPKGSDQLVLQGGKHLIQLQLNARSYQYDGRTVSLADPPLRTDDGWYVPLPIAAAAWNGAIRYDATKKTVQFIARPAAHAVRRSASTSSR